jgi:predicted O-methyltransferase YrrM
MKFEDAARIVDTVPAPHIPASRGRVLYDHIREHRPEKLLELGTARGGSAIFMAAALEANGAGQLTTVDSSRWNWRNPTPREVIDRSGLAHRITLDKRYSTYTWFLKTELERCLDESGAVWPEYDFIFLDGAKYWSTDGLAVVLMEKLLRPGGWLLLDDLGWTYEQHTDQKRHYEIEVGQLSEEERTQPHLRSVFDLLIRPNEAFDRFLIQDDWWGWARKAPAGPPAGDRAARPRVVTVRTSSPLWRTRIPAPLRRQLARVRRLPARLASR